MTSVVPRSGAPGPRPARRGPAGALAAVLLAGVLTASPAAALADPAASTPRAPAATTVALQVPTAAAIAGETVTMTARVDPGAGRRVVLQRQTADGWARVAVGRADAEGVRAFATTAPRRTTAYRAVARAAPGLLAGRSRARDLLVRAQESFLRLPARVRVGETATAVVESFPRRPGREVALQRRTRDGSWRTVAVRTQDAMGQVYVSVTFPNDGVVVHRAKVRPADGARASVSDTRRTVVTP